MTSNRFRTYAMTAVLALEAACASSPSSGADSAPPPPFALDPRKDLLPEVRDDLRPQEIVHLDVTKIPGLKGDEIRKAWEQGNQEALARLTTDTQKNWSHT